MASHPWQQQPFNSPPPAQAASSSEQGKSWVFALLPVFTMTLAAWVPSLWAALRLHPTDRTQVARRMRLFAYAACYGLLSLFVFILFGAAGEDSTGTPSGPLSDMAGFTMLGLMGVSTVHAFRMRRQVFHLARPAAVPSHAYSQLPGVNEVIVRRQMRDQYRRLAADDPGLARELGVGHPERQRSFQDGGLLDLNTLDAAALVRAGGLSPVDAEEIVRVRSQRGRLSSIDEVVVFGGMTPERAEQLRDYCIFL